MGPWVWVFVGMGGGQLKNTQGLPMLFLKNRIKRIKSVLKDYETYCTVSGNLFGSHSNDALMIPCQCLL